MADHSVEIRAYKAHTDRFEISVQHQRQILVDGKFVGYCPVARGPIAICGSGLPAEVRRAVEDACGRYWGDDDGAGEVAYAPTIQGKPGGDE